MKLSVIIPLRDEVQIVERNVEVIHTFFVSSGIDFELIAVDDSDDGTYPILLELQQRLTHLTVCRGGDKKGYRFGRVGFKISGGDIERGRLC